MTDQEIAGVVAGLTKVQRKALLNAELDGALGRYFARFLSVPTGRGLIRASLGTAVWSGVMLSARGLAVRTRLMEADRG